MSELADTIHGALRAFAENDRSLKRFGAAAHRYELAPPVEVTADLPADLLEFLATVGSAGAGPGYGFRGIGDAIAGPWQRGVVVAHLGCGYAAVVAEAGEVWIDATAIGVVKPIAPSFTYWYVDWVERLAHNAVPEFYVPAGACPLPNALSGFLGMREQQLGLEPGTLAGDQLRSALGELGAHSIEIAAESSLLFHNGSRVDPCLACALLVENLVSDGLRPDVVRPA